MRAQSTLRIVAALVAGGLALTACGVSDNKDGAGATTGGKVE